MIRAALIAALMAGTPAWAAPDHGLLRNQTGLPLVFPLQVRTTLGKNYALILENAETSERALSAYIEGGRFFRLLVPPGRYNLNFAMGEEWVDGEALFGPETVYWDYPDVLEFGVEGLAVKRGHLIDLRGLFGEEARTAPLSLCPGIAMIDREAPEPPPEPDGARSVAPVPTFSYPLPPGPRDPGLDGAPELGRDFGNYVEDVPLWQRLDPGAVRAPDVDRPEWRGESRPVQRLC